MKRKRFRRAEPARHGADHGPDLETLYFQPSGREHGRDAYCETKSRQLCRQVQQRLEIALGGELEDPLLQGLWVESVEPEAGGRSLVVRVVVPSGLPLLEVLEQLKAARGHLRQEIASAIHRKRTPNLQFVAIPEAALAIVEEDDDLE